MYTLTVQHLTKKFGDISLFEDFTFSGKQGEIIALIGPNGCGKSTLLNILAGGLSSHNIQESCIYKSSFPKNSSSYVFQHYRDSLLPWRTGYENLALPLEIQGYTKEYIATRIHEIQQLLSIQLPLHMYPYRMSGGQQQMLAFMRALVTLPVCLLLDEPFASLDYQNTLLMRNALQRYYIRYMPLIIIVTHDIEEAVHLASTIVVLSSRPTQMCAHIENNVTYPRELAFLMTQDFVDIKNEILRVCEYVFASSSRFSPTVSHYAI